MSFGKSKSKTSQKQAGSSQTTINPWAQSQWEGQTGGIMDAVNNYTSQPFQSYDKPMVAGMDASQTQARQMAGQPGFDPATDTSKYYNPFEQEVVGAAGAFFDENLARSLTNNQARATQAGAYGGSRHGVADAELMRTSNMDRAGMMADLRYKGFNDARDTGFRADENRRANVGMLEQLGANARELEQARLDMDRAEFDREAKDRLDKLLLELQSRQGILGSIPITTNTNTTGSMSGTGSNSQVGISWSPTTGFGA